MNSFKLRPLDGSPHVSANCWKTIIEVISQRAKSEKRVRFLEWGSGNSTVNLVKTALDKKLNLELISVEHETKFFPWLAETVLSEFQDGIKAEAFISWQTLGGPIISLSQVKKILEEKRNLKTSSLNWQILLDNKRLQHVDLFEPKFNFSFPKIIRQAVKLALVELGYLFWLIKGINRGLIRNSSFLRYFLNRPEFAMEGKEIEKSKFLVFFEKNPKAGCLKIKSENLYVELWHLPEIKTFVWDRGLLLDGSMAQLPDYVCLPLEGRFDVVFIDGRARVSCIKRVHRDKLLKPGGWLFVHDAFRLEMAEGFKLFGHSFKFIRGSNITLNGQKRTNEEAGPPLVQTGDTFDNLEPEIMQELFIYQNKK